MFRETGDGWAFSGKSAVAQTLNPRFMSMRGWPMHLVLRPVFVFDVQAIASFVVSGPFGVPPPSKFSMRTLPSHLTWLHDAMVFELSRAHTDTSEQTLGKLKNPQRKGCETDRNLTTNSMSRACSCQDRRSAHQKIHVDGKIRVSMS